MLNFGGVPFLFISFGCIKYIVDFFGGPHLLLFSHEPTVQKIGDTNTQTTLNPQVGPYQYNFYKWSYDPYKWPYKWVAGVKL